MRIRRLVDEKNGASRNRRVVWFGSYGKNTDGSAKFVNSKNKHDNFATATEMVKDSLLQKLSVIRHELWYDYQYGMPLVDNNTKHVQIDTFVMQTITQHPDVLSIVSFTSKIEGTNYICDIELSSKFGNIKLTL